MVNPRLEYKHHDMKEGEVLIGVIQVLPQEGAPGGNSLCLHTKTGEKVSIHATAKKGHTVLEKRLKEIGASVGTEVRIEYTGKRQTSDGEREYRNYLVEEHAN